jgi:hypothetical protein
MERFATCSMVHGTGLERAWRDAMGNLVVEPEGRDALYDTHVDTVGAIRPGARPVARTDRGRCPPRARRLRREGLDPGMLHALAALHETEG